MNWTEISSLATGAGTLVLAMATFASVRSANRSARLAELALQEQRRPIFTQSRLDDPVQKIMFVEGRWVRARGGHGVAEHDGAVFFAMSLRNVGSGIGVCQGWHVTAGLQTARIVHEHTPEDQFRPQTRDLYIPAGDIGMWQGALRDRSDPTYQAVAQAIDNRDMISVELLYSDQVGGQRTISRFALVPYQTEDDTPDWFATINRHWYLDRPGPRSDEQVAAAAAMVLGERVAGEQAALAEAEAKAEEAGAADGEAAKGTGEPAGARPTREPEDPEARTGGPEPDPGAEGNEPRPTPPAEAARHAPGGDGETAVGREGDAAVAVIPRPNCE